ncbi:hypothetical protein HMI55_004162 [Coelomomyces lativittatus]|nr:hypothetical protein HMI55_004162 [Coelomomyces lativittatus]
MRSIFGPHICGETLDFDATGNYILAGSHSIENTLSIHSLDPPAHEEKIKTSLSEEKKMTFLYYSSYSSTKKFFYAGGGQGPSASNELKMFLTHSKLCVGHVFNFPGPLFSASTTKDDKKLAIGGAFPYLIILNVETSQLPEILH